MSLVDIERQMDETADSCRVLIQGKECGAEFQSYRCDRSADHAAYIALEILQNFRNDNARQRERLCPDDHAPQFDTGTGRRRTQEIDPHRTIDRDRGSPRSNSISPHGLRIALPDAAAVVPQNALAAFRTDEQLEGLHDLAFSLEARELSRLADRFFVISISVLIGFTMHRL
jgi:hypothetical protein